MIESVSDEGDVLGRDLVEELKQVSFFSELGSNSIVRIVPALEQQRFPAGSTIVKKGDPADSYYIVRSGDVQVMQEREGKPAATIATLGAREGFGEMAILSDQPYRSFTIVAMTEVELWCLPKNEFKRLLSESLTLNLYFSRLISERLRTLQERVFL